MPFRRVPLGHSVQNLLSSTDDVDPGAIGGQGLRGHEPDAAATTGHDGHEARDVEEVLRLQFLFRHGGREISELDGRYVRCVSISTAKKVIKKSFQIAYQENSSLSDLISNL